MDTFEAYHKARIHDSSLGAKITLASGVFNQKLGEVTDYVFNKVGKEVQKHLDECSQKITKIQ